MQFRPYVNKKIAQRLYTAFIKWGEENGADSFGYYVDGEPWIRIKTSLVAYSKWTEYFENRQLRLL